MVGGPDVSLSAISCMSSSAPYEEEWWSIIPMASAVTVDAVLPDNELAERVLFDLITLCPIS